MRTEDPVVSTGLMTNNSYRHGETWRWNGKVLAAVEVKKAGSLI